MPFEHTYLPGYLPHTSVAVNRLLIPRVIHELYSPLHTVHSLRRLFPRFHCKYDLISLRLTHLAEALT